MVDFEERGVPGVFVASTEFRSAAATQSKLLGFEPAVVYVPHPIQDRTDEEMAEVGRKAIDSIIEALTEAGRGAA